MNNTVRTPPQPYPKSASAVELNGAINSGDLAAIQAALQQGAPDPAEKALDVGARDSFGDTRLIWASGLGKLPDVMALLDEGMDINATGIRGQTPLTAAVINNHADCVYALIAKGADVNAKDDDGKTALDHVENNPYIANLIRYAQAHPNAPTAIRSTSRTSSGIGETAGADSKRQAMLARIATEDPDFRVRRAAVTKLSDQASLVKLAGNLDRTTPDSIEAVARICLALNDPVITNRIPNARLSLAWGVAGGPYYSRFPGTPGVEADGENLFLFIRQGSKWLVSDAWHTDFPSSASSLTLGVTVQTSNLLSRLLSRQEFTAGDLRQLINSRIPEVRQAASASLSRRPYP